MEKNKALLTNKAEKIKHLLDNLGILFYTCNFFGSNFQQGIFLAVFFLTIWQVICSKARKRKTIVNLYKKIVHILMAGQSMKNNHDI